MTCAQDRKNILQYVSQAHEQGASWQDIAQEIGLSEKTLQRWRNDTTNTGDRRPDTVRPVQANALSEQEKQQIVGTVSKPEFSSLPPAQIVAMLAERGEYIASESSFYRVMHERKMQQHRGKARAPRKRPDKPTLVAAAIGQVWTWDITYLPSDVNGQFYKLYMIMDLFSRKIVGWEVFMEENSDNSQQVLERTIFAHGAPDYLHGDNGKPLKNANLHAMLLGREIQPSHSRPRVSNDNAHAESLFRTVKYHPSLPDRPFTSLEQARNWVLGFVRWYNHEHRHKGIGMVTPNQKHRGEDQSVLAARREAYAAAKARKPERWNGRDTRAWKQVTQTTLNPVSTRKLEQQIKRAA